MKVQHNVLATMEGMEYQKNALRGILGVREALCSRCQNSAYNQTCIAIRTGKICLNNLGMAFRAKIFSRLGIIHGKHLAVFNVIKFIRE
ncbi:MAG: hypothetical protein J1D88_07340 [Treponema sp.]|nr:hypothetical protein [Treponema sp.]